MIVWPVAPLATSETFAAIVPTPSGIGLRAMMLPAYAAPVATPVVKVPEVPEAACAALSPIAAKAAPKL